MADTVRVRLYDVGFGDCFLLEFPRRAGAPFRVLVDCGAHRSGYPRPGWKPEHAVRAILNDSSDTGREPKLDVVVATHRHQDHVSGFTSELWRDVAVGEVWMPWTEDPDDPEATVVRERQARLALGLQMAFDDPAFAARTRDPDAVTALRALAANSLTNESAMRTLHRGFRGAAKRRFLAAGAAEPMTFAACPGLAVHVLGPSRDVDVVREMDPPGGQSFLRFLDAGNKRGTGAPTEGADTGPFSRNFRISPAEHESGQRHGPVAPAEIKAAAAAAMTAADFAAAVSLDKAVNGTSLMLMFAFRGAYLLFPGDAQWGTWEAALRDPTTRNLLESTTFYKIGHHGSHNATPVEFVEKVLSNSAPMWGAVASVHPIASWPEIPRAPLLEALRTRADRVVRSDQPDDRITGTDIRPGIGIDFHVPAAG